QRLRKSPAIRDADVAAWAWVQLCSALSAMLGAVRVDLGSDLALPEPLRRQRHGRAVAAIHVVRLRPARRNLMWLSVRSRWGGGLATRNFVWLSVGSRGGVGPVKGERRRPATRNLMWLSVRSRWGVEPVKCERLRPATRNLMWLSVSSRWGWGPSASE